MELERSSLENLLGRGLREGGKAGTRTLSGGEGDKDGNGGQDNPPTAHGGLGMRLSCRHKAGWAHSGEAAATKKPLCAQLLSRLCSDPQHTSEPSPAGSRARGGFPGHEKSGQSSGSLPLPKALIPLSTPASQRMC